MNLFFMWFWVLITAGNTLELVHNTYTGNHATTSTTMLWIGIACILMSLYFGRQYGLGGH